MITVIDTSILSRLLMMLAIFYAIYKILLHHLRISISIAMGSAVLYSFLCLPLSEALADITGLRDNRILLPFLVIYFLLFCFASDLPFIRNLVIYLWATVLMLFPYIIAKLCDTIMYSNNVTLNYEPSLITIHFTLTMIACLYIRRSVIKWDSNILSPDFTIETLWIGWLSVPILFLGLQIALLPTDYTLLHNYYMQGTYIFFAVSLGVLYLYLTSIFHSHMSEYVAIQQYKEAQRLSEIQTLQYKNLQNQIEADKHARHDFKHTLHLLSQLAATKDTDALRDYIRKYTNDNMNTIVKNYCDNAAINAVINYYEKMAATRGINTTLQVDLTTPVPLSDPELASLIGNIMENAIDACESTITGEKKFSFSILIKNESTLYIVSSNTYDGELIEQSTGENTIFSSKKIKHHGLGLKSIRQTVDKYDGTLRISGEGNEFHLDVAIDFN